MEKFQFGPMWYDSPGIAQATGAATGRPFTILDDVAIAQES